MTWGRRRGDNSVSEFTRMPFEMFLLESINCDFQQRECFPLGTKGVQGQPKWWLVCSAKLVAAARYITPPPESTEGYLSFMATTLGGERGGV